MVKFFGGASKDHTHWPDNFLLLSLPAQEDQLLLFRLLSVQVQGALLSGLTTRPDSLLRCHPAVKPRRLINRKQDRTLFLGFTFVQLIIIITKAIFCWILIIVGTDVTPKVHLPLKTESLVTYLIIIYHIYCYHPGMWVGNVFSHVCMSFCVCFCLFRL